MNIATKQFQILTDINLVWDFFVDIYERGNGGVPAPFFEYAIQSSWMDTTYQYLDRLWLDGDKVVGFVFNESPVTDVYFKIRPGYEFLAKEMVDYAIEYMPNFDNKQQFMLFNGQEILMEEAKKRGFRQIYDYEDRQFDFENKLDFVLPEGFHFVNPSDVEPVKLARCCWYGFDHGDKGPFENWEARDDSSDWTPQKSYKGILGLSWPRLPTRPANMMLLLRMRRGNTHVIPECGGSRKTNLHIWNLFVRFQSTVRWDSLQQLFRDTTKR